MGHDAEDPCMPAPPGAEHKLIAEFVGTWKSTVQMWMGPGEPMVSAGTMKNTMLLDGRYLEQVYTGDPNPGPFPNFAGRGFWGYNNVTGQYEGYWIDNASNQMAMEYGQYDPKSKSWNMTGEMVMPGVGPMKKRSLITKVSDREHTLEMFFTGPDGQESKGMYIRYVRA